MDRLDGFVVGLGKKWVLLARTMDGGYHDGLVAIRIRDVARVTKDRTFETRFANTQPRPEKAVLDTIRLDRTADVLKSMSRLSPLLAVSRERAFSDSLWIGEYQGRNGKHFGLWEVRADATWYDYAFDYRFRSVTAVSVGGHYLTALAATAPRSPAEGL